MFNGKIHYFWPFSPFFLQNIDYLWAVHVNSHFSTHFSADAINMSSDWGVSINRGTPKSSSIFSIFSRMFHYKPSILGYSPFMETPMWLYPADRPGALGCRRSCLACGQPHGTAEGGAMRSPRS